MLDEMFLFWVVMVLLAALVFIIVLDALFIVILWRWEVVSGAHRRRRRQRQRREAMLRRFDKIAMTANTDVIDMSNGMEHERLYGAPW